MKSIKKTFAALALVSLLISVSGQIHAQKPPDRRVTRENIITLMLLRMTQVLDLNEEQAAQLFPVVNRIEKEKFALNRQIGERMRDLRSLLQVDKNLSLEQQAKFLIFFQDFNQYLRDKLSEARQRLADPPVKRSPRARY